MYCLNLIFLVGLYSLQQTILSSAYEIDPTLKFNEMVEKLPIGIHFENLTVHHPFYEEIAFGTLPLVKFQVMTQQDDLYVQNLFWSLRKLSEREENPERKAFLERIGSEDWSPYFQMYYDKFNFSKPTEFLPTTLDYSAVQFTTAKYDHIGVALATLYPCYTVWAKMGTHLQEIANFEDNPYIEFLDANSGGMESPVVQEFIDFVNGYYDRLNNTILKQRMLDSYTKSVELEYAFASANYEAQAIESIPPPKFTDLFESVSLDIQEKMIYHSLFEEIAYGTLPLIKYATLLQQDQLYLKAYYQTYLNMELKEANFSMKASLVKDPTYWTESWFKEQSEYYGFGPVVETKFYTEGYVSFILKVSQTSSVLHGLASLYPCKILWYEMGVHMYKLANLEQNPNHIYKDFVKGHDPTDNSSLTRFQNLINEYYADIRGNLELQHQVFEVARASIFHELTFVNGIYGTYD